MSWTKAKAILNTNDPLHLKAHKADGRVLRANNKFLIVYDDTIEDDHHNTWTIIHEIGHIFLGHLTDYNISELNRTILSDKEYEIFEKEAHYFAAEFLMPTAILRHLSISVEEIALLFDVSETAAKRKYQRVFDANYIPKQYTKYDNQLIRNFCRFFTIGVDEALYKGINNIKIQNLSRRKKYSLFCRKCFHCHSYINDESADYCPYCGERIETQYSLVKRPEGQTLIQTHGIEHIIYGYTDSITLENNKTVQKLKICPVCLNHQINIQSEFCQICGTSLYNICPKDALLPSFSGSYCPSCGRKTTAGEWYSAFEEKYKYYLEYSKSISSEHVEYPYWEYVKSHPKLFDSNLKDLISSLIYSAALVDDYDNIYIYVDNIRSVDILNKHIDVIRELIEETDQLLGRKIEVIGNYDI